LPNDSSGIANIRERLRLSGGELAIDSEPDGGTTLRATVPARAERTSHTS